MFLRDWIKNKLKENNFDYKKVQGMYDECLNILTNKCSFYTYRDKVKKEYNKLVNEDIDIVEQNVKLAKQKQYHQDTNRIERKSFREYARIENALKVYYEEMIDLLKNKKVDLSNYELKKESENKKAFGIVHITDTHFNELIRKEENIDNVYDFVVASKRLKKLVMKAKRYFSVYSIDTILLAFTGDLLNSDRRLDELLNQATNRAKATILSVILLQQMFIDLMQDFVVYTACVTGNEGRAKENNEFSDLIVTDNYDFTIFNILKLLLQNQGVNFIIGDWKEKYFWINDLRILMLHGESIKKNAENINDVIAKYTKKGKVIDLILFGDKHSAYIGDNFARGGSLCGDNPYADKSLQLFSRATQNIHIVFEGNSVDSIKIDLQDVNCIEGYCINEELEAYNAKSLSKLQEQKTIFKVVI